MESKHDQEKKKCPKCGGATKKSKIKTCWPERGNSGQHVLILFLKEGVSIFIDIWKRKVIK